VGGLRVRRWMGGGGVGKGGMDTGGGWGRVRKRPGGVVFFLILGAL